MLSLPGSYDFARHYFRNLGWCLFLELLRCFSSLGSPPYPMYSDMDALTGGFPHSEIYGSMLTCQLPVAYRRLSRLSSPIIAKASTTCSCSLDPITLTSFTRIQNSSRNYYQVAWLMQPDTRYAVMWIFLQPYQIWQFLRMIRHYLNSNQVQIRFDAIKMSSEARLHIHAFPLTTLISTLWIVKEQPIDFDKSQ